MHFNILDEITTENISNWNSFISSNIPCPYEDLNSTIEEEMIHIRHNMLTNEESVLIIKPNLFAINDTGYGDICKKCKSPVVLIRAKTLIKADENTIWIPSLESFMHNGEISKVPRLRIPINTNSIDNYQWRCLCCSDNWHNFKYKKGIGLYYKND